MKKILFKIIFLLIFVLFNLSSVFAWNEVGHKISTYIAWEHMNPEARQKAVEILLKAPEDSDLNVHYDRFNSRSEAIKRRELFMFASIWSDVIRNRDFDVRYKKYHQGDWHYGDIFWKQENGKAIILKDFPEPSGKAVYKLYDFEKILRDSSYQDEEKAIALAWFLHVGGDLHNPLHNASRITENSPKGDQGGNRFILIPRTEKQRGLNLHAYWDSILSRVKPRKNDDCDADYLSPIARKIMKKHKFSKMRSRLKLGDYKAWNMEGFSFLNNYVYNDVTRNQLPSKKYRKRTFKLAEEQIALAGYRLGETLNQIFSKTMAKIVSTPKTECRIIRKVLYPVSKRRTLDQKMRIALLDICPPNKGMVARPMTSMIIDGEAVMYEYDVIKVFADENEAKKYAKENKITDISYE